MPDPGFMTKDPAVMAAHREREHDGATMPSEPVAMFCPSWCTPAVHQDGQNGSAA